MLMEKASQVVVGKVVPVRVQPGRGCLEAGRGVQGANPPDPAIGIP